MWFAQRLVGMDAVYWLTKILLPIVLVTCLSIILGYLPKLLLEPSFMRVCLTSVIVEAFLVPACWFIVMDGSERAYLTSRIPFLKSK